MARADTDRGGNHEGQSGVWVAMSEDRVKEFEQRQAFVDAYCQAVSRLDFVDYVFYLEAPHELDVFTVFRGDRRTLRPALYAVEAEILERFPKVYPDIRILPIEWADIESLRMTTRQAFARS